MITGSMVALVTPMSDSGAIDWAALKNLVDWHIAEGTDAIVAVGTSGESATLDVLEHGQAISAVVEYAAGRVPVIAGTGANSTAEAIELTAVAKEKGADACLLVTPYYNKPTQEGLFLHHQAIASAVDVPQILYNVPGRTACDMLPDTVIRLAGLENIVGIKEATGDIERARELIARCPSDFAVYSGDDPTALNLILAGGNGNISVTANVAPQAMSTMCALALKGDETAARNLNERLQLLHERLFLESNPIPVKWALAEMGKMGQGIRLPLTVLDTQYHESVREALRHAGISLEEI
ncbi:MAG: 4-hydroxy-tetrahydrodipicolinate synthase [Pseudomonadales bacterium]